jgi:UDP-N-acetylmuramate dehydrogenase
MFCVHIQLGGIENLSLIPGSVGAAPVQNIGAYGVELKDVLVSLEAFDFQTGKIVTFKKEECDFGYRDSIFKRSAKGQYFITAVTFRLQNIGFHKLNVSYGAIAQVLQEMQVAKPTIADISQAVIHIRSSKLPDPKVIGNAGSFFKNPEVPEAKCNELRAQYPKMPFYDSPIAGYKKLAAGWLIEQCGWKGKSLGNAAVHNLQALVLTNPGNATGKEIKALASAIQQSVLQLFGVALETEVNIL